MSPKQDENFDLGDYVEVKDRIAIFYELFAQGRLVTSEVRATTEPDGKPRIWVEAAAYRTPDDPLPGRGWSWIELPGSTPYTKGSELENAETSAWGRAIGSLGILIDRSIASANEVRNKDGSAPPEAKAEQKPEPKAREAGPGNSGLVSAQQDMGNETVRELGPITRVGAVVRGQGRHSDLEWRQAPDGYAIGFLLEVGDGKPRPQVFVNGPLAVSLFAALSDGKQSLEGNKITVSGEVFEVSAPKRRTIYRIVAERIETDDWTIPANAEAPTVPMFPGDDTMADKAIDDALYVDAVEAVP